MDVDNLLKQLLSSGVLQTAGTGAGASAGGSSGEHANRTATASRSPVRTPTPPIPCPHQYGENEQIERRELPPSNLKDFSMRVLKMEVDLNG